MSDRAALFQRLRQGGFDLLVVGGGITGAGIARDAALRGLRVCLVEKSDLAAGTSSASSKLIHGGLRYLEQLELSLVREGVRERALLMRNAPHLARPLPFLFPVYSHSRVGRLRLQAGMWLYDMLAAFGNYRRHRMLSRKEVARREPALDTQELRGAALYYDCLTDDARLTLETALHAEEHGAVLATYTEVVGFVHDETGRTTGVRVRDALSPGSGPVSEVGARVVAVAAGPWTDRVLQLAGGPLLRPTKGSHLVVEAHRLPVRHAVVITHPRDGRVMFAIPWGEQTVLGTTDTDEAEDPDLIEASGADVDYLLDAANQQFPRMQGTREDVISTWSGLRPLMGASAGLNPSDVSREHALIDVDPGMLAIAGGKLTTYRKMAEEVVDRALRKLGTKVNQEPCRTAEMPLPGASDPEALQEMGARTDALAREFGLDPDVVVHLVRSYGLRLRRVLEEGQRVGVRPGRLVPGLPYLADEVVHAVTCERAERLEDVLRRRTQVFLKTRDQGLSVSQEVARIMAPLLGWDAERTEWEVRDYRDKVEASRRWQAAPAPA